MDYSNLSEKQKEILNKVRNSLESDSQFDLWMSTPNKSFRNMSPIDVLKAGNFDYFDRFFSTVNNWILLKTTKYNGGKRPVFKFYIRSLWKD